MLRLPLFMFHQLTTSSRLLREFSTHQVGSSGRSPKLTPLLSFLQFLGQGPFVHLLGLSERTPSWYSAPFDENASDERARERMATRRPNGEGALSLFFFFRRVETSNSVDRWTFLTSVDHHLLPVDCLYRSDFQVPRTGRSLESQVSRHFAESNEVQARRTDAPSPSFPPSSGSLVACHNLNGPRL